MTHLPAINGFIASAYVAALVLLGCNGSTGGGGHGGSSGSGGQIGTGGASSSGGSSGSGGSNSSGGSSGSGGVVGTGGKTGTGGATGSGGASSSGGSTSSGGVVGSGGAIGSGGRTGSGGSSSSGGALGTGGASTATGGSTGTGGTGAGGTTANGGATGKGGSGSGGATPDAAADSAQGTGGSPGTCPATVMKSGDSNQTVNGRTYILHIPTGYTGTKPLPLVVDFHALGGNGSGQKGLSHWDTKGDANMFITAFPDSASNGGNGWNVGMCCQDAQKNQVDDVGFTRAMIKQIEGIACVDPKRIYASGCSNGGGMTYKVSCDMADVFAAGAPVDFRCVYGGTTASPSCDGCKPARPISIIHFDNTGDTSLVPYAGGMTSFAADCPPNQSCTGMGFPSAAANFTTWQTLDQCTGSTAPTPGSCVTNSSCQGGAEVMICVRSGGSHCGNYAALNIVDTAWTEFQKLSLP